MSVATPAAEFADSTCTDVDQHIALQVVHIQRRPFAGQFSIENLFSCLRDEMRRAGCDVGEFVVPYHSKGLVRRVLNGWCARRHRGDVYHVTGDIQYVAMFLPRERTILTIHDCWALERLTGLKRWLLKLFWFDLPVRHAKFVTVISDEAKRQLQRHLNIPDTKIHVIPNPVSPIYRPCIQPFHRENPRILHVGTTANKNLSRLIQALRRLRCHLHIVGHLDEIRVQELQDAEIEFSTGRDMSESQMYQCYCEADLVSFVSTYEGFGMPILEANAVGRPVVTSNVSSVPEVAGGAACLVDPYDVASIRRGICRVIEESDYREQLVREGFRNLQRFRADVITSQYLDLYQRVYTDSHSGTA